jgi:carbamate kinase
MCGFGTPDAEPLNQLALEDLEQLSFPAGSMGPKIEACKRFVKATESAANGVISDAEATLHGNAGASPSSSSRRCGPKPQLSWSGLWRGPVGSNRPGSSPDQ